MDKHFLENFIRQIDPSATRGSHQATREPWYNPHGDCIQFQTVNEAVIGERIDNHLTIYRSAVSNQPIGFQMKDVHRLIQKYGCSGIEVNAQVKGQRLVRVTGLLLYAYQSEPPTINRTTGYSSAISALTSIPDRIELPSLIAA